MLGSCHVSGGFHDDCLASSFRLVSRLSLNFVYPTINRLHAPPRPDCHVFGHTHFGWDQVLDGVRYIQAPLSYPSERKRDQGGPAGWSPFLIWHRDAEIAERTDIPTARVHILSDFGTMPYGSDESVAAGDSPDAPASRGDVHAAAAAAADTEGTAGGCSVASTPRDRVSSAAGGSGHGDGVGSSKGLCDRLGGGRFVAYPQRSKWSDHYRTTARDPTNLKLAPWAAKMWGPPVP